MLHKILILTVALHASVFAVDFTKIPFKKASGETTSLEAYKGKAVVLVNVASKCGLVKQYKALQELYEDRKDEGLVILAFPCNDFDNLEPGSMAQIHEFCTTRYHVTFPLMMKIHVKGEEQHPLYAALTGKDGPFPGDTAWNFGKIIIGRDGKPVARIEPRSKPDGKKMMTAVERALKR